MALMHALLTQYHTLPDQLLRSGATQLPTLPEQLLRSGAAGLTHVGPCGFTTLHAAVMVGRFDLLPVLVAAGAPKDMPLECSYGDAEAEPLRQLLAQGNHDDTSYASALTAGYAPLAYAVRLGKVHAVRALVELGASSTAGSHGRNALCALDHMPHRIMSIASEVLPQGVEHCLSAAPGLGSHSWLWHFTEHSDDREFGAELLAALEAKAAAGQLRLDRVDRALQLLEFATDMGHDALLCYASEALERLSVAAAGGQAAEQAGERAWQLLEAAFRVARRGQAEILQTILSLGLTPALLAELEPAEPEPDEHSLLATAAIGPAAAATVHMLCQAGVPVTAHALEAAVEHLAVDGVRALVSHVSPPGAVPGGASVMLLALETYEAFAPTQGDLIDAWDSIERRAAQIIEALLAHGCQPAHDWEPADDSFPLSPAVLFLGTSGVCRWEPDVHPHWPPSFHAAVHTLLLAATRGAGQGPPSAARGQRRAARGCHLLGTLPHDVLLSTLRQAAEPMSAWM